MNEPVLAGASGIALGCGASLPRHKMDGFAGSLGEHSTGRHGTARGQPAGSLLPALLPPQGGAHLRFAGTQGCRGWGRCGAGRAGREGGKRGGGGGGRGCQREICSASNHLLRELRLHLPPLFCASPELVACPAPVNSLGFCLPPALGTPGPGEWGSLLDARFGLGLREQRRNPKCSPQTSPGN